VDVQYDNVYSDHPSLTPVSIVRAVPAFAMAWGMKNRNVSSPLMNLAKDQSEKTIRK